MLQIFREWHCQRANKICIIGPNEVLKGEHIGFDMQELTERIENMNAKSLSYWLYKLVRGLQISGVNDISLARFTIFPAS